MASEAIGRDPSLADDYGMKQLWIEVNREQAWGCLKSGHVVWFRPGREEKFLVAKGVANVDSGESQGRTTHYPHRSALGRGVALRYGVAHLLHSLRRFGVIDLQVLRSAQD